VPLNHIAVDERRVASLKFFRDLLLFLEVLQILCPEKLSLDIETICPQVPDPRSAAASAGVLINCNRFSRGFLLGRQARRNQQTK
jgi:hypothetical protein